MAKKPDYCEQNDGKCELCALVNYGRDCRNNPIPVLPPKKLRGRAAAEAAYDGFHGRITMEAVEAFVGAELHKRLTGREYGLALSAVNTAFHAGKKAQGAEVVDGDYVWVECIQRGYPLAQLRMLPDEMKVKV